MPHGKLQPPHGIDFSFLSRCGSKGGQVGADGHGGHHLGHASQQAAPAGQVHRGPLRCPAPPVSCGCCALGCGQGLQPSPRAPTTCSDSCQVCNSKTVYIKKLRVMHRSCESTVSVCCRREPVVHFVGAGAGSQDTPTPLLRS